MKFLACFALIACTLINLNVIQLATCVEVSTYKWDKRLTLDQVDEKIFEEYKDFNRVSFAGFTRDELLGLKKQSKNQCKLGNIGRIVHILDYKEAGESFLNYLDHFFKKLVPECVAIIGTLYDRELRRMPKNADILIKDSRDARYDDYYDDKDSIVDPKTLDYACEIIISLRRYASWMNRYTITIDDSKERTLLDYWAFALKPCMEHLKKYPSLRQ